MYNLHNFKYLLMHSSGDSPTNIEIISGTDMNLVSEVEQQYY